MRKMQIEDVLDLTTYEKQRKDIRPKIIEIKNMRRIHVGPKVTYLFENYDTMWYQVQEMTRAERIVEEEGIMGELNAYNELIPDTNQLSTSMFIEIDNVSERKSFLTQIVDLPDHTYLEVDGEKIVPIFDPRQGSENKLSSVQYLKFDLTEDQVQKFTDSKLKVVLGFDHPLYTYVHELTAKQKSTLYEDMTES
ncbi:MAG: DUF3501 family protein [Calditrichia bacterium]|nr:DUF3501 family protein [Calditrichia bacterium]